MKIFVFGATGFIGSRVADALVREGYKVSGLCRTATDAKKLRQREIAPVVGDMLDPASYEDALNDAQVIIVCGCDYSDMEGASQKVTAAICEAAALDEDSKTVIVTSGMWLWGESDPELLDENSMPDLPDFLDWKPEHDEAVINNAELKAGVIVAPGIAYGRQGSLTGAWFRQAARGNTLNVVGDGTQYWPTVHVDDLARAYVKIVNADLSGGHLFFVNSQNEQVSEMANAVARTAKGVKIKYVQPDADASIVKESFEVCLAMSQKADSSKARRQLGWVPNRYSFVDGVETYSDAYRASSS